MPTPAELFSDDNLRHLFSMHPPKDQPTGDRLDAISGGCLVLAQLIGAEAPSCAERTLALRQLELCWFWARAAVARNQHAEGPVVPG
jgi:hypothetical protein